MAIGISVPLYWGRLMARVTGDKQAEHLCKNAVLLSPAEAVKVCPSYDASMSQPGAADKITPILPAPTFMCIIVFPSTFVDVNTHGKSCVQARGEMRIP